MTDNNYPITPPPELVRQWMEATRSNDCIGAYPPDYEHLVATQAARWGADMQLVVCMNYVDHNVSGHRARALREHCRPKPPSLKEQALAALDDAVIRGDCITTSDALPAIRRALESLPN